MLPGLRFMLRPALQESEILPSPRIRVLRSGSVMQNLSRLPSEFRV